MNPLIVLFAALTGYLLGSISFARVIVRLVAPGQELTGIEMEIADAKEPLHVQAYSGTAVASMLGDKWGGITALLDILKAAIPTLAFRLIYPEQPYHLVVSALALVGHNWPLYYRFKGGRGISPLMGGFLVVDWLGTVVTTVLSLFLGIAVKQVLVAYVGGMWLMIPWLWIRTRGDPAHVIYVIAVNIFVALAMIPDIRTIIDRERRDVGGSFEGSMDATPMGRGIKRMASWFRSSRDEGQASDG
jgi:glycerol-3-phosphate acyltransferase PlsY